jgi:hypothetical protein
MYFWGKSLPAARDQLALAVSTIEAFEASRDWTGSEQHSSETQQPALCADAAKSRGEAVNKKTGESSTQNVWLPKNGLNRKASMSGVSGRANPTGLLALKYR